MKNNLLVSEFYCVKCGNKGIPIVRHKGKGREAGHLKKLFCLKCQEEVNHVEIKAKSKYTYDDFLVEFEHNNFDEDGNRKMSYGELRNKIHNDKRNKE